MVEVSFGVSLWMPYSKPPPDGVVSSRKASTTISFRTR